MQPEHPSLRRLVLADGALRGQIVVLFVIVGSGAMVAYVVVALAALDLLLPKLVLIALVLLISVPVEVLALRAIAGHAARRIAELRRLADRGILVRANRVSEDWVTDSDDDRHWTATYRYDLRGEIHSFDRRSPWTWTKVFHPRAILLLVDPASTAEPQRIGTLGEPIAATVVRLLARLFILAAIGVCGLVSLTGTMNWWTFAALVSFVVLPLTWIVTAIASRLLRRIDERGAPAR